MPDTNLMDLKDTVAIIHNHTKAFDPIAILQLMFPFNLFQAVKELGFLVVEQLAIQVVNLFPMAFVGLAVVCQIVLVYHQHLQTMASQAIVVIGGVVFR